MSMHSVLAALSMSDTGTTSPYPIVVDVITLQYSDVM